jgi:hypothetical protein
VVLSVRKRVKETADFGFPEPGPVSPMLRRQCRIRWTAGIGARILGHTDVSGCGASERWRPLALIAIVERYSACKVVLCGRAE